MNMVNVRAYCIRPILAAGFALALAFTISCSSDDKDDGGKDGGELWCKQNDPSICSKINQFYPKERCTGQDFTLVSNTDGCDSVIDEDYYEY